MKHIFLFLLITGLVGQAVALDFAWENPRFGVNDDNQVVNRPEGL